MKTRLAKAYSYFGNKRFPLAGFPESDPGAAEIRRLMALYFPGDQRVADVIREVVQGVSGFHPKLVIYRFRDNAVTVTYREVK